MITNQIKKGAQYNVEINLKQILDEEYSQRVTTEVSGLMTEADSYLQRVLDAAGTRSASDN